MSQPRHLLTIEVRGEQDVVLARQRARQIATLLGFDLQNQTKIGTAVSEIVRNAYRYAGGGRITFLYEDHPHRSLVIQVADRGAGIANLDEILAGRYTSRTGLGLGLVGTRRIMDRFTLNSAPGTGTTVAMCKFLPPRANLITPEALTSLSAALAVGLPGDPLGEVQQQNQELLRVLNELQQRQTEMQSLNRELEDTNRGVVALYAELDARADFLRRASEVKSRFLSNVTHEFRTPLNSIVALASMLESRCDGDLTNEQDRQVGFIRRSAEVLSDLVNDLLDIAKVDAGKVVVKTHAFEVSGLFGALKGMLKPLIAAGSSVALVFDEPSTPMHLETDEGKVSQILRNLISNALKFTDDGEVRVAVRTPQAGRVVFSVTDTGVGIRAKDLQAIFEEFAQIDTLVQHRFKGTGLGLPLSKRLAGLLGGRLDVHSDIGKGSCFLLDIPMTYSGNEEGELVTSESPSAHASNTFKRQTLIIDDDEVSRYLLRGLLPPSFEVVEADSGAEGIQAARRLQPDVIFLDLHLPDMTGFEVLEILKTDADLRRIKVIIYSAKHMDEEVVGRLSRADAIMSAKGSDAQTARAAAIQALVQVGLFTALEPGHA